MAVIKNKPWTVLRMTRKQYAAARPWKLTKYSRETFESIISTLPIELFDELRLQADAEHLLESIFGEDVKE